jgi:Rap1a immunity proteins
MRTSLIAGLMLIVCANQGTAQTDLETALSANFTMPGCREARPAATGEQDYLFLQGLCHGKLQGVVDTAQAARAICPHGGVADYDQALRAVVQFIDARPNQGNQRFTKLALEALRAAWPCR